MRSHMVFLGQYVNSAGLPKALACMQVLTRLQPSRLSWPFLSPAQSKQICPAGI